MTEKNSELDQATLRLTVGACTALYIIVVACLASDFETYVPILWYMAFFFGVAVPLRMAIKRWPGHFILRRLFAMTLDYASLAFALIVGGEGLLPVYAALLWVTLGNGMRFGSRYLAAATLIALATLVVIFLLTPFWRGQPYVFLMLIVTTIVVPAYAHILLTRTRIASEEAIAANQEKSRFLAQASHDLRQPIHSIGLFTACLRDARLGQEELRLVDNIDRSLHIVSQLFRSILDIYTLDNGQLEPQAEPVHLGALLQDVVKQNTEAARWAGVELRLRPCRHWVNVNAGLLATMVQNLVSNTLKYASGQPVLIGVRPKGSGLAIVIYDKGRGIAAEHLPEVFKEFYRVRHVRDKDVEGLGLGLSIVKRISLLINLDIQLDSRLGKGTRAMIQGLETVAPRAMVDRPVSTHSRLQGLRVCLVEDDANVLMATSALLEKWGCEVETHSDGVGVTSDCDIIIADFDLGTKVSGSECIAAIREQRGWEVPAMIMTGHEIERIRHALHHMNISILAKPVRPPELRATLLELTKNFASVRT
ncbi:hybrid sensor histidine kinase/response regulator [Pseudomonas brassicacearum]|uniref:ATP-binding response regulator n=1 Tax=Pseudomonas TaxID=286 RepID=UPI0003F75E31|nr:MULTISPECIES: hybrid sensor histidine kinase/response regulator [Pseudomonas]RDI07491.1 signal transduction histidine kinase [Pseudomonas fluorescens]UVM47562.1 hybrid sensor histidine kinase/response regulator [Pseudomonas brassicacearum]BBP53064.1 two-component sensor [Pseudomonas sp. St386]